MTDKKIKSKQYGFIIEGTQYVPNHDIKILTEDKVDGKPKISAMARLQEADQKNGNGRVYPRSICESIVNQLSPKASSRSLLMEIDHPLFVSSDVNVLKKRAAIIEINNCGALLKDIYLKDKQVYGVFETLSGFKGPDLYNLIVKDKVDVGFSLRALGAIEALPDGTVVVKDPIRPITYDVVSNPSHTSAKVLEFLPETALDFVDKRMQEVIFESIDSTLINVDRITIMDSSQVVTKFLDDIINERFLNIISNKIKFNL